MLELTKKVIRISINMGDGTQKTFSGLACDVSITKNGLPDLNTARGRVFGMSLENMAQLTVLAFKPLSYLHNKLVIEAGTENALHVIFRGELRSASADFNSAPDVSWRFEASSGCYPMLMPKPPVAVSGTVQASELISSLATEAGYSFKNEGVSASIRRGVFNGSPIEKAKSIAEQIGAQLLIDDDEITLLPLNSARSGTRIVLSDESGLIGYPEFTSEGIHCKCLYQPELQMAGSVEIKSIVPKASGSWKIYKLTHNLSAFHPTGGPWETVIDGMQWANGSIA